MPSSSAKNTFSTHTKSMPASYTHYAVARDGFLCLTPELQTKLRPYLPLYFFGAQGADFCFFYPSPTPKTKNLGRLLHNEGGYAFFKILSALGGKNPRALAYALGYASHYAADVRFHPYVYYLSGKSLLKHSHVEARLDKFFRGRDARTAKRDPFASYRLAALSKADLDELFFLYAAFAAFYGYPTLLKPPFLRSVSLFNAYTGGAFRLFKQDFYLLSERELLNADKAVWQHPKEPSIRSDDGALELYGKAVVETLDYAFALLKAAKEKRTPQRTLFSKNFLSGL